MKKLLDWFLFSSSFTACCAVGLCMATEKLVNGARPPLFNHLHALVFGSTLLVYNIHHTIKKPPRIPYGLSLLTKRYKMSYIILSVVGCALVAVGLWGAPANLVVVSVVLGFISLAYSLPVLPFKSKKRIRDFGWLKILSLAGVWTIATSVLPMIYLGKNITAFPFEIGIRFTFIFAICIIFDIRDVRADSVNRINTLPKIIGLHNSYKIINISLLLSVALGVLQYLRFPYWNRLVATVAAAAITRLVAYYLKKHPSERAYFLIADGVMIVYALLVLYLY